MSIKKWLYIFVITINISFIVSDVLFYNYIMNNTSPELMEHYRLWKTFRVIFFFIFSFFFYGLSNSIISFFFILGVKKQKTYIFLLVLQSIINIIPLYILYKFANGDVLSMGVYSPSNLRFPYETVDAPYQIMHIIMQPFLWFCIILNSLVLIQEFIFFIKVRHQFLA